MTSATCHRNVGTFGLLAPRRLDFDRVAPKLYQGGAVDPGHAYPAFSMIVLCAQEQQPDLPLFNGEIVRASFDDTPRPTPDMIARAAEAATRVAHELRAGGRVLVTCAMGLNRSGLVTALALTWSTRFDADTVIAMIRRARGNYALSNRTFERVVRAAHTGTQPRRPRCRYARR